MRKINFIRRLETLLIALFLVGGCASYAFGDDNFSLAPAAHDKLIVLGPNGVQVAEVSVPTVSQVVTVGSTSFQISYGLDANNELAAVLSPSSSQPQPLHFTVLNKTIETDKKAVVTLTFPDPQHVVVDPGFVGTVTVNSRLVHHRDLSRNSPGLASPPSPASPAVASNSSQPAPLPTPSSSFSGPTASNEPFVLAPPPLIGSPLAQPPLPSHKKYVAPGSSLASPAQKLYWAEPVTPPTGPAPVVASDQMKLVAVHGSVTVKFPGGKTETGVEGMLVPSGSIVTTGANSSAAVFMGGVDSARFMPDSSAEVTQTLNGSVRTTRINLSVGTVFNRVGHRPGESQDYQVHTPTGIAAARGTDYAVEVGDNITIEATNEGTVTLTDSTTGVEYTIAPGQTTPLAVGAVPQPAGGFSPAQIAAIAKSVQTILQVVQQFNTNTNAALASTGSTTPKGPGSGTTGPGSGTTGLGGTQSGTSPTTPPSPAQLAALTTLASYSTDTSIAVVTSESTASTATAAIVDLATGDITATTATTGALTTTTTTGGVTTTTTTGGSTTTTASTTATTGLTSQFNPINLVVPPVNQAQSLQQAIQFGTVPPLTPF